MKDSLKKPARKAKEDEIEAENTDEDELVIYNHPITVSFTNKGPYELKNTKLLDFLKNNKSMVKMLINELREGKD